MRILFLMLSVLVGLAAGCGQKGPLVPPPEQTPQTPETPKAPETPVH